MTSCTARRPHFSELFGTRVRYSGASLGELAGMLERRGVALSLRVEVDG